jgi:hypothetical protein
MTLVIIVVVIVVVAALIVGAAAVTRRRRLQQRFGPEYDRLVGEHDSKLKAESELKEREKRVHKLDIRPLSEEARASYAGQWAAIQERFVDDPEDAVTQSQVLVAAVMKDRGYPTEHREQIAADLSVEHSSLIENYRAAEQISENAATGTASTEDLRQAMIHYRSLFRELLGGSATAEAVTPDGTVTDGNVTDGTVTDGTVTRTEAPVTTADGGTTGAYDTTNAHDREAGPYDGAADGAHDGQATGTYDRRAATGDDLADADGDGDVADDDLAADDPTTRTARRS